MLFEEPRAKAIHGIKVGRYLATALQEQSDVILNDDQLAKVFVNKETGEVLQQGDLMVRPDLAATFARIAKIGPSMMYDGKWHHKLAAEIQAAGGIVTADDIAAYRPRVYDALEMDIAGLGATMYGVRPPGSGALLGFMLNVMSGFTDMYPDAKASPETAGLYYHRLVETFKFAYARRMQLGDELYDDVTKVMAELTSPEFADKIRDKIDDEKTYFDPSHYGFDQWMDTDHGTAHMNVIDSDGNAVACTTTINIYFGSKVMSPSTGILFNGQMDDFSSPNITSAFHVPPSPFNHIAPGKRPQSSMTPAVFVDKLTRRPLMVIGAEGGTQITTAVASTVLRTLMFHDSIKTVIDAPRIHDQLFPFTTIVEKFFPAYLRTSLEQRNRMLGIQEDIHVKQEGSIVNAIHCVKGDNGTQIIYANSDYRKVGSVDGY